MDKSHARALAAARLADELATIEAARLGDTAVWSSMSAEDRRDYARYQMDVARRTEAAEADRSEPPVNLGPRGWKLQQRLAATAAPWQAEVELHQQAARSGPWMHAQMSDLGRELSRLESEHKRLAGDYSKRDEAASLEKQIIAKRDFFDRLEAADEITRYAVLSDPSRKAALADAAKSTYLSRFPSAAEAIAKRQDAELGQALGLAASEVSRGS